MEQSQIDKILTDADRRAVYVNQVEHAKERFLSLNVLYWDGHVFKLTRELFSYVETLLTDSRTHIVLCMAVMPKRVVSHILLDDNNEPVLIPDIEAFLEQMQENHTEALNQYYDTYTKLRESQTAQELIEAS